MQTIFIQYVDYQLKIIPVEQCFYADSTQKYTIMSLHPHRHVYLIRKPLAKPFSFNLRVHSPSPGFTLLPMGSDSKIETLMQPICAEPRVAQFTILGICLWEKKKKVVYAKFVLRTRAYCVLQHVMYLTLPLKVFLEVLPMCKQALINSNTDLCYSRSSITRP